MVSAQNKTNSLFYGVAAIALGLIGQSSLTGNITTYAIIFYAAAVILIIFALRKQPGASATEQPARETRLGLERRGWLWVGALSGLVTLAALTQFATDSPTALAWLLHLSGLALFILATFLLDRQQTTTAEPPSDGAKCVSAASPKTGLSLLLLIMVAAGFMRLYRFDQVPYGTWYDEADNGLYALRILNDPGYRPVYVESTNLPAHFLYLVAFSFRLFGVSTLAIRAVSVVIGLLTVAAAYLVGRELFSRRMGLVLACLLAVCRWDINWSRIGMHGVSTPLFELLTFGFLLRGLRRGRFADFAWAGFAAGLGLNFYASFRLFPLVVVVYLLQRIVVERGFLRRSWAGLVVMGLAALLTLAPVAQYALRHPNEFWNRTRMTSVFAGKTPEQSWQAVKETARKHLLMFNYRGDPNGRHNLPNEPMLDPVSGVLMVLGLGVCLWRGRQPRYLLLPLWLGAMLLPGIFSLDFEAPQSLRAIGSLPAALLLVAVTIEGLWQEWDQATRQRNLHFFGWPLLLILGQIGYANYHTYFDLQAQDFGSWAAFSTAETIVGRVMAQLGDRVNFYVMTFYYDTPTIRFLAPNVTRYHRLETTDSLPLELQADKGAVIFLDPEREAFYSQAKQYYPRATFQEYKPPFGGPPALYAIFLSPSDIASLQGLTASYYRQENWTGQPAQVRQETELRYDWRDGDPFSLPFSVEWQGVLRVSDYGPHWFILKAPAEAELYLDETLVLQGKGDQSAQVTLAKGNHALRLRAVGAPGHFELTWQPPNEAETSLPPWVLYVPPVTNHGLLGKYYPNGDWRLPVAFTQIDPWIDFYFHIIPLPRPYTVEWEGKIAIPQSGRYAFGLESRDESQLQIDGRPVVASQSGEGYQEGAVDLQEGLHDLRLRFADRTSYTHISLYWTLPGESKQIVPPQVLLPPQGNYSSANIAALPTQPITPTASPTQQPPEQPTPATMTTAELLWEVGQCGSGSQQFQSPHGVAADRQGNVYVADSGNHRVVKLGPEGQVLLAFGSEGDEEGAFLDPFDLVVDADGSIVVLDSEAKRVLQRFTPEGVLQAVVGMELGVYHPRGLGIDAAGDLYVADTGGLRVLCLSSAGNVLQQWGRSGTEIGAGQPVDAAVAPDGALYMSEAEKGIMWRITPDGNATSWIAVKSSDTVNGPHIAIAPDGLIYVTDPEVQRVIVYNSNGQPAAQFGQPGNGPGQFLKPVGIAVGPGRVYVADNELCRVQAFKLSP
jgi:DNA-binding beta-propeller fold protein YncE/4-amino-4-deoxy-L-arabinose transferase-like glycosyltransferase